MIIPLISSLLGENGPLGKYFKIKSDTLAAEQNYKLELLKAQTEIVKTEAQQVSDRLNSTSQEFKQMTFWFICAPVLVTMLAPVFSATMWNNFTLIPEWFQILFVSVYSSIWGLPIAKEYLGGMFKSLGSAIEARRDFKLEKAKLNREVVFAGLRNDIFPSGMTQSQVDGINKALDLGEK